MEIKLKLNGENVVLNISDVTVNGKPVCIDNNKQVNTPEFKDGDFCYFTNGSVGHVFIFKSKRDLYTLNYHAILHLRSGYPLHINDWMITPEAIRLVSHDERLLILKALKENSLRWDEETKEILDLKWKPKLGEKYFSFDEYMQPACFIWSNTRNDEHCYLNNKCFKTLEEAKKYAKKFAEILKNRDL